MYCTVQYSRTSVLTYGGYSTTNGSRRADRPVGTVHTGFVLVPTMCMTSKAGSINFQLTSVYCAAGSTGDRPHPRPGPVQSGQ